jgi:hypothetical protein
VTPRLRIAACFALVLLLPGCGGSNATGAGAKSGTAERKAGRGGERNDADEGGEDDAPAPAPCADGSCVECGAGLCPKGFYCDESAPGGAACGWLPECAKEATCGCVKAGLGSGCECEEKNGAPFVKCQ